MKWCAIIIDKHGTYEFAQRVGERPNTYDIRKLRNIRQVPRPNRKAPKPHRMIAQRPDPPLTTHTHTQTSTPPPPPKNPPKTRGAPSHTRTSTTPPATDRSPTRNPAQAPPEPQRREPPVEARRVCFNLTQKILSCRCFLLNFRKINHNRLFTEHLWVTTFNDKTRSYGEVAKKIWVVNYTLSKSL